MSATTAPPEQTGETELRAASPRQCAPQAFRSKIRRRQVKGLAEAYDAIGVAFPEALYLAANPDVAEAVGAGTMPSGRKHYVLFGKDEIARGVRPCLDALRTDIDGGVLSTFLAHVDAIVSPCAVQARYWLHPAIIAELDRIVFEIIYAQESGLTSGDAPDAGAHAGFDHWRRIGRADILSGARGLPSRKIPACLETLLHDKAVLHAESYHMLVKIEDWRGFFYAMSAGLDLEGGQLAYERRELQTALCSFAERFHLSAQHLQDLQTIFDADWYVRRYPDVAEADTTALIHFVTRGIFEGRDPTCLFETAWYARTGTGSLPADDLPFVHFLREGCAVGRSPCRLFDTVWYLGRVPPSGLGNMSALAHYLCEGARLGLDPGPLFDAGWYHNHNPDLPAGINPLVHFLDCGARQGRDPSPLFDMAYYLAGLADPSAAAANPLLHYLAEGRAAGHDPCAYFDTSWYLDRHPELGDATEPLLHYVLHGAAAGFDPSALFDTDFYLAQNPDVAALGLNPLSHYLSSGRAEGRAPRRPDTLIPECGILDIPYEILRMPQALSGRDVCVVVIFSAHGSIGDHVSRSLSAYKAAGYAVIAVVQTDGLECSLTNALCDCDGILLRANHGWDFAAWATALAVFPDIWSASSLILTNDSIYGPVAAEDFTNVVQRVRSSRCDVVALTDSHQVRHHMMSYFTAITQSGLAHPAIRRFWGTTIRSLRDKDLVIGRYELTSIAWLASQGATCEVLFETARTGGAAPNPTLFSWRDLLARGFPFVKVQALRDTLAECDHSGWQAELAGNPDLTRDIEAHLAAIAAEMAPASRRRPIPVPRRRFDVDFGLTTSYGAIPACRPSEATDLALQVPFGLANPQCCTDGPVAVIVHIYYVEFCDDLLAALGNTPVLADLYVSTDTERKKSLIQHRLARYTNGSLSVRVFANVGRDIAPMLLGFADVFARYDIFVHLHSKKSLHDGRLAGWRRFLLDNLLGSREIVQSILSMFGCADMGVVFSQHYPPVSGLINFGTDYGLMRGLLDRCDIPIAKNLVLDFPSGSFFWARTKLFRPLLDGKLTWADFPPETGQVDGTIAHAIERSILYLAEAAGLRWAKVAQAGHVPAETLIPVDALPTIEEAIARAYRPLLGNPLPPIEARALMGETRPIGSRPDPGQRPRLNLLLPTLQPDKIFGGISTALAVFGTLQQALDEAFDYRIVVTTDRVTMDAMLLLPAFRLLQIGSMPD